MFVLMQILIKITKMLKSVFFTQINTRLIEKSIYKIINNRLCVSIFIYMRLLFKPLLIKYQGFLVLKNYQKIDSNFRISFSNLGIYDNFILNSFRAIYTKYIVNTALHIVKHSVINDISYTISKLFRSKSQFKN